ncbi:MAG: endonuclease/exonuclease/phosphatase family protein [Aeromicrobium sp.]
MILRRRGLAALLLGVLLFLGIYFRPAPQHCPEAACPFAAPSAFQWVESTETGLKVWWKGSPKAFAYRVELSPNPYFAGLDVVSDTIQPPTAVAPVAFTGLTPGTAYHLRVTVLGKDLRQASTWSVPTTAATKGAMHVNVGTYNIRNPDDSWPQRVPAVADGIVSQGVHVLGLQEVYQAGDRQSLLTAVNARSQQSGGPVYGMAPAWNSDLGYDDRVLYDSRAMALLAAGAKKYDYQVGHGEVDRWFSWASLRDVASGWAFLFITTHLAPGDNHADFEQWKELVKRANELKASLGVRWIVIAGDFNTTKFEKPANSMLKRMRENGFGDVLGQKYRSYGTRDARAEVKQDVWLNSFNDFDDDIDHYDVDKDRNGNSVDWIFASNDLRVPFYRVYARYDHHKLVGTIPSDHFMVMATLDYEPTVPLQPLVKTVSTVVLAKPLER